MISDGLEERRSSLLRELAEWDERARSEMADVRQRGARILGAASAGRWSGRDREIDG